MNVLLYREVNNDWTDWYIELYENYPCNSKNELCKREGEIIRLIGTSNKYIAGRNNNEYRIENADKIKEASKQYRIENADKINEKSKQYHFRNIERINEKHKQYYI
jgi:hypothetical protein